MSSNKQIARDELEALERRRFRLELRRTTRQWEMKLKRDRSAAAKLRHNKKKPVLAGRDWKWLSLQDPEWRYLLEYHYKRCERGNIDADFLTHLWKMQEGRCAYCEGEINRGTRVLEHMQPLCRGGINNKTNVAFACWDCNTRKGTQTYQEFVP